MEKIKHIINEDAVLSALIVSTLALASAWSFQLAGYAPCDLCWTQRYPYMAIIGVAIIASALKVKDKVWVLVIIATLAIWDAGVAIYHSGVEQKWWQGPQTCTGSGFDGTSSSISMDTLYNIESAIVRCDEIPWEMFGLSMAAYNAIVATSLSCYCLYHIRKRRSS